VSAVSARLVCNTERFKRKKKKKILSLTAHFSSCVWCCHRGWECVGKGVSNFFLPGPLVEQALCLASSWFRPMSDGGLSDAVMGLQFIPSCDPANLRSALAFSAGLFVRVWLCDSVLNLVPSSPSAALLVEVRAKFVLVLGRCAFRNTRFVLELRLDWFRTSAAADERV